MPVTVSMHACAAWPMNIDFTAFSFFLKGYSVEGTVEQLMALQSVVPEKTQAKRRSSSASSSPSTPSNAASSPSSSSDHLVPSPSNSADLYSPIGSAPCATYARNMPERMRDERQQRYIPRCSTGGSRGSGANNTGTIAGLAVEPELLTEGRRVVVDDEHPEELTLLPAAPKATTDFPTSATDSAETCTLIASGPVVTAVDTSTNAARPPHVAMTALPAHGRPLHLVAAAHDNSFIGKAGQATAGSSSHCVHQHPHHHHRHRHHHHHHRHFGGTREPITDDNNTTNNQHSSSSTKENKKSRHSTATRSSSAQHTAAASTTTSFAAPPMWSYDSSANMYSSAMLSVEDGTTTSAITVAADDTTGKCNGGPCHKNNYSGGDGKNLSSENRRRAGKQKRYKERQCFFLNEDYIKFQRQLQDAEAIGGVGTGASSLQSRFLFEEVTEQFQAFRELAREEQLGSPYAFLSNYYVPIPIASRLELLRMYYETDPGLFRWAFGDKLNRFDLPDALAAVREEFVTGNWSTSNFNNKSLFGSTIGGNQPLNGAGGNSALGASGTAGSISSCVGSFWSGRWKSSPGKLATMDIATLVRLSEQHTDSLRRQWENVKRVCATVAALYRGKGGMCVPLNMSLLTTIQQVFGLRHNQALDYATAAFGYEHRLETRLFDRLNTFSEYGVICSIIASVWCDDSGYFLSESFHAGCRRVGRLLDEYRLLSELHPFIFGEPMRPRWQVQLDEVQRVITTSSLVDKNTVASATAVAAGNPVASGANSAGLPASGCSNSNVTGCNAGNAVGIAAAAAAAMAGGSGYGNTRLSSSSSSLGGGGGNIGSSGVGGWEGGVLSPNATTTNNTSGNANVHSPFSGNGQYSRRFLMEFPSLTKHLLRICVALSNNGGVNDALDIFFTRIYSYLEMLSSRSAPAIVSMVMNAAGAGGLTAVGQSPTTTCASFAGNSGSVGGPASTFSGAFGKPPLPPHKERVGRSHSDLLRVGAVVEVSADIVSARASPLPPSPPQQHQSTSSPASSVRVNNNSLGTPKSMPLLSRSNVVGSDRRGLSAVDTPLPAGVTAHSSESRAVSTSNTDDVFGVAGSAIPCAVSTVVNTSLFYPASALHPLSAAVAAHQAANNNNNNTGSFTSSPLMTVPSGRGFSADDEPLPEWSTAAAAGPMSANSNNNNNVHVGAGVVAAGTGTTGSRWSTDSSFQGVGGASGGANVVNALSSSQISDIVRKAVDKRYLRELCMLLAALPKAWQQLTMLTPEDHAATDKTMTDLTMALKAITQVLMASDDFH